MRPLRREGADAARGRAHSRAQSCDIMRAGVAEVSANVFWAGVYAVAFYEDPTATLDGLREAVATLEDAERIARRVFGGAHPLTMQMEHDLKKARAKLRARETLAEAMAATTLGDTLA